jgi:glycosyltransferase involved in cell wall biosynthesis
MGTGYGTQTAIWAPLWKRLGHEVTISGYAGMQHASFEWKDGIQVLAAGSSHAIGMDVLGYHYEQSRADVVIALCDCWALSPRLMRLMNTVCWTPVDTEPLGQRICEFIDEAKPRLVAMSRYGQRVFSAAGYDSSYIPHGIPCDLFRPPEDRDRLRAESGFDEETFVVVMNQANRSGLRKNLDGQILAFLRFHERHPKSKLLLHMGMNHSKGQDLPLLIDRAVEAYGFTVPEGTISFPDQGAYAAGAIPMEAMPGIYGAADVTLQGVMAGGFELPLAESEACGTPVIATDGSAMTEVAGPHSWLIPNQELWVENTHAGFWRMPMTGHQCSQCGHGEGIEWALEEAWQAREDGTIEQVRKASREHALQYDVNKVLPLWADYLTQLEAAL